MDVIFAKNKFPDIATKVDNLILRNKQLENDKNNLYSEYLLELKNNFLFDTKYSNNKKENIGKQVDLVDEGFHLFKDIEKVFNEEPDLLTFLKAKVCTEYFLSHYEGMTYVTKDLSKRCEKYLEDLNNFINNYKFIIYVGGNENEDNHSFKEEYDLSGKKIQRLHCFKKMNLIEKV